MADKTEETLRTILARHVAMEKWCADLLQGLINIRNNIDRDVKDLEEKIVKDNPDWFEPVKAVKFVTADKEEECGVCGPICVNTIPEYKEKANINWLSEWCLKKYKEGIRLWREAGEPYADGQVGWRGLAQALLDAGFDVGRLKK